MPIVILCLRGTHCHMHRQLGIPAGECIEFAGLRPEVLTVRFVWLGAPTPGL